MKKNKETTKAKIFNALVELLETEGFQSVGINSIARKAGVSKVLIYRYYGGLEGLLKEYKNDPKSSPVVREDHLDMLADKFDLIKNDEKKVHQFRQELAKDTVTSTIENLKFNNGLQEILRWQTIESNAITDFLQVERQKRFEKFGAFWSGVEDYNIMALTTIINSAIDNLAISKYDKMLDGTKLSEGGWDEIQKALLYICEAVHEKQVRDNR